MQRVNSSIFNEWLEREEDPDKRAEIERVQAQYIRQFEDILMRLEASEDMARNAYASQGDETDDRYLVAQNNLSDIQNPDIARENLGIYPSESGSTLQLNADVNGNGTSHVIDISDCEDSGCVILWNAHSTNGTLYVPNAWVNGRTVYDGTNWKTNWSGIMWQAYDGGGSDYWTQINTVGSIIVKITPVTGGSDQLADIVISGGTYDIAVYAEYDAGAKTITLTSTNGSIDVLTHYYTGGGSSGGVIAIPGPKGDTGATGDTGPQGDPGADGPNNITTSTTTDITGILKGDGANVSAAVANTDYAAATHESRHRNGGADSLKLDDLATPDDNTDLNASTSYHGLLPKLDGASKKYLGGDGNWYTVPLNQSWFFTETASDIGGYEVIQTAMPGGIAVGTNVTLTAAPTLIEQWIASAAETPDLIGAQVLEIHMHAAVTNGLGVKDSVIYFEVYKRDSVGTETLMGTSDNSPSLTDSDDSYEFSVSVSDTSFSATDRLVLKCYGTPSGVGADPEVTIYYDGDYYSRISASAAGVPSVPAAHAASHTDGTDDIQDATAAQKGLMTLAYAGKLDGIENGAEVNNISDINATDLTDTGDTSLHYHSADRDRVNHTGTQTASTISDFDTEVSNNADVAANTAARHGAVTVSDSAEIDFTLTGQDITASLIDGSIDETKLDVSVNASLDLADSSVQPGDDANTLGSGAATAGLVPVADGTGGIAWGAGGGAGDVVGPASATDNAIARYDGATGKLIQNSVATLDDSGNLSIGADTDLALISGRARLGYYGTADAVAFSHYDHFAAATAAIRQTAAGAVGIGAAAGQNIDIAPSGGGTLHLDTLGGASYLKGAAAPLGYGVAAWQIRHQPSSPGTTTQHGFYAGLDLYLSATGAQYSDAFKARLYANPNGYTHSSGEIAGAVMNVAVSGTSGALNNVNALDCLTQIYGSVSVARVSGLNVNITQSGTTDVVNYHAITIQSVTDATLGSSQKYGINIGNLSGASTNRSIKAGTAPSEWAGPHYCAAGTAAAPSIAGTADANTGLYWIGSDNIGVSCGGSLVMDWDTAGATLAVGKTLRLGGESFDPTVADTLLHVGSDSNVSVGITAYGGNGAGLRMAGARGTEASPTATQTHDYLGYFGGHGYGATGFTAGTKGLIAFFAAENWTDAVQGSYIDLQTTPVGSTIREVSARIQAGVGLTLTDTYLGPYAMIGSTSSAALTNSDHVARNIGRQGQYSAIQIYDAIYNGGMDCYDAVSGVTEVASGSTVLHATGIAGYIDQDEDAVNCVAVFGAGRSRGQDQELWGINTVIMDNATYATHSRTGQKLLSELDYNVCGSNTEVLGLSIGGNSLAQPAVANGFVANTLGTGIKWTTAFWSMDGVANTAYVAGATATSGTDVDSQPFQWHYYDGAGAKKVVQAYVDAYSNVAFLSFNCTGSLAFKVLGSDIFLDTGQGLRINGNVVVTDQQPHIADPSGGSTVDSEARTAINSILAALETHGLLASS